MQLRRLTDGFDFGEGPARTAYVHLRKTAGRKVIVTLTDLSHKVITGLATGALEGPKRYKRSPLAVEHLVEKISFYFRFYKIEALHLILRMRLGAHVFSFLKACSARGVPVSFLLERRNFPHNGIRCKRRPRK